MLGLDPATLISRAIVLVIAFTIHEFSHALSAKLLGDFTAERAGRLTLNPLAHLDIAGTLAILFIGFGWGKACPYNPYNLKNQRWGPALIGLAGPLSNILSGIVFTIIAGLLIKYSAASTSDMVIQFFILLAMLNFGLTLFNLIPVPPLDGSKLLLALVPERNIELKEQIQKNGQTFLMVLVFLSIIGLNVFGFIANTAQWGVEKIISLII